MQLTSQTCSFLVGDREESLYIVRCLGALLTSTHWMPITPPHNYDTHRCLPTLPNVPWEGKSPQVKKLGTVAGSLNPRADFEQITSRHLSFLFSSFQNPQGSQVLSTSPLFHLSLTSYSEKPRIFSQTSFAGTVSILYALGLM